MRCGPDIYKSQRSSGDRTFFFAAHTHRCYSFRPAALAVALRILNFEHIIYLTIMRASTFVFALAALLAPVMAIPHVARRESSSSTSAAPTSTSAGNATQTTSLTGAQATQIIECVMQSPFDDLR